MWEQRRTVPALEVAARGGGCRATGDPTWPQSSGQQGQAVLGPGEGGVGAHAQGMSRGLWGLGIWS